MSMLAEVFQLAVQHHQAGKLPVAESLYRQVLAENPQHPDALHLLGVISHQKGQNEQALALIRQSLTLRPDAAMAWSNLGAALLGLGQRANAIDAYRKALELQPTFYDAQRNLGTVLSQQGDWEGASIAFRKATALRPNLAENHYDLAIVLAKQQRWEEAVSAYLQAAKINPGSWLTHANLGNAYKHQGELAKAVAAYQQAASLYSQSEELWVTLGNALKESAQISEAAACYRKALELNSKSYSVALQLGSTLSQLGKLQEANAVYRAAIVNNPEVVDLYIALGRGLREIGEFGEAITILNHAITFRKDDADLYNLLGVVLCESSRTREAIAVLQKAAELATEHPGVFNNLGLAYKDNGQLDEAIAAWQRSAQLNPESTHPFNNLGSAHKDQGNLVEAVACFRQALEIQPENAAVRSNYLLALMYCPEVTSAERGVAYADFERIHAQPLQTPNRVYANSRIPTRTLRIGYVSPDLFGHPVGRFMLPLLESHDHEQFKIYCYSSTLISDVITERCRQQCDVWHNVAGLSDERVAELVEQDQIDILVDLSMHTANNRLLMFARKPAPVQVTYLGSVGTTGLTAIDYRLTDPYLDPPTADFSYYSETAVYLPEVSAVYRPVIDSIPVSQTPAIEKGCITFGCLNNFCKVSTAAIAVWAGVLRELPTSKLLLYVPTGKPRDRAERAFAVHGITPERLEFVGRAPMPEYIQTFHRIDIGLDPFPYNGGTTSFESLWMGVPFVTLAGDTGVGRGGVCILSNLGLAELVAMDEAEYIRIAVELANDLPRLSELRSTIRPRMQASPLMDAPRFARNMEAAFRTMWQQYCEKSN